MLGVAQLSSDTLLPTFEGLSGCKICHGAYLACTAKASPLAGSADGMLHTAGASRPHLAASQDFSGSGINSKAYVSVLGLLTALWTLTGYDAPAHLIEETRSGDTTAGWPALYAVVASAITGLMYLLALTLCLPVRYQLSTHAS